MECPNCVELQKSVVQSKNDLLTAETTSKLYNTHLMLIRKALGDVEFKKIQERVWEFVMKNGEELK